MRLDLNIASKQFKCDAPYRLGSRKAGSLPRDNAKNGGQP